MTTDTAQLPPLTEAEFNEGTIAYEGVLFVESEDGACFAYGHLDRAAFAAAVQAYYDDVCPGEYVGDDAVREDEVAHAWAVTTQAGPEWMIRWGRVNAETSQAFPITLRVV